MQYHFYVSLSYDSVRDLPHTPSHNETYYAKSIHTQIMKMQPYSRGLKRDLEKVSMSPKLARACKGQWSSYHEKPAERRSLVSAKR